MSKKVREISWVKFFKDAKRLAELVREHETIVDRIIWIARDGLVPAGVLSKRLGIRNINVICIQAYKGKDKLRTSNFLSIPNLLSFSSLQLRGTIVLDAICDSGHTMQRVHELLPLALKCSVYVRHGAGAEAMAGGLYAEVLDHDDWLKFPW